MTMKKKILALALVLVIAAVAVVCVSCASNGNNGQKKLTAGDIEGTWKVDYDASTTSADNDSSLAAFMVMARPEDSAVVVFKGGKITAEWEAQDGKHTSELGAYEVVNEGDLIINGFKTEPTLEGNKLTLYQFTPKEEGVFKKVDGKYVKVDDDGKESPAVGLDTTMVLVRK